MPSDFWELIVLRRRIQRTRNIIFQKFAPGAWMWECENAWNVGIQAGCHMSSYGLRACDVTQSQQECMKCGNLSRMSYDLLWSPCMWRHAEPARMHEMWEFKQDAIWPPIVSVHVRSRRASKSGSPLVVGLSMAWLCSFCYQTFISRLKLHFRTNNFVVDLINVGFTEVVPTTNNLYVLRLL